MKKTFALVLALVLAASFVMASACDDIKDGSEKLCGPCPDVEAGGASIVGDARVDGFFRAVGNLKSASDAIQGSLKANLEGLAAVYDLDISGMTFAEAAAEIRGEIEADVSANVDGDLVVKYDPPKCAANASLAVEAQASCEAEANCDVSAECQAGNVSVECSGVCQGSCEGSCEGELKCEAGITAEGQCSGVCEGSCEVQGPSVACEGTCSGTCTVEAGAHCSGSCSGACNGTCDGDTVNGIACDGVCEGECDASCEMTGSIQCEGECNGKCEYTEPQADCQGTCKGECNVAVEAQADCEGEVTCEGKCEGSCSAGCEGEITPPSCSVDADCSASADCQASAKAEASASLECSPPSLAIDFSLKAGLDAQAKAEFVARIDKVRAGMAGVLHGMVKMKALVQGDADLGIEPPIANLTASIRSLGSAVANGDINIDVPVFRIACVASAVEGAVAALASVGTDGKAAIEAQIELAGAIGL